MTRMSKNTILSYLAAISILHCSLPSLAEALLPHSPLLASSCSTSTVGFTFSHSERTSSTSLFASSSGVSSAAQRTTKQKTKSSSQTSRKNRKKGGVQKAKKPLPDTKRKPGPGRSLSKDELSEHVAGRYMEGKLRHPLNVASSEQPWDAEQDEIDGEEDDSSMVGHSMEQEEFIKELNSRPALVLNADFQPLSYLPLSLWSWQDAVKAVFTGKVQVVDVYPDFAVRAANFEVPLPSVIALSEYVPHKNQRPAFTRRNVFLRDEYKCQYCNDRFHTADLSLDHVHPRCMGGQLTWENAVTSCLKCNGRKGSMPVTQLRSIGMRLIREPRCPTQMELAAKAARMVPRRVHPTWKPFLGIAESPKNSPKAFVDAAANRNNGGSGGGDEEFIDDRYFDEASE